MIETTETSVARPRFELNMLLPYVFLHLVCLGVFWTGVSWKLIGVCLVSFYVRKFGIGAGFHRYFAHRSFKTSRAGQLVLALLGTLTVQKGVLWWAETHRRHHRHADTPEDIHSPTFQGFIYSHSGWFLDERYQQTTYSKVADLAKYPELRLLNDWRCDLAINLLYAFALYMLFGWGGVVWGFAISTVMLWHGTHLVQSVAHSYGGYRRCPTPDKSRNHWLMGLFFLGEYHNNHHYYPSSCRQGFAWWEIDIEFYILKMLSWVGLVWDLRLPPESVRRGEFGAALTAEVNAERASL